MLFEIILMPLKNGRMEKKMKNNEMEFKNLSKAAEITENELVRAIGKAGRIIFTAESLDFTDDPAKVYEKREILKEQTGSFRKLLLYIHHEANIISGYFAKDVPSCIDAARDLLDCTSRLFPTETALAKMGRW